jgi:tetratricopeptide (TPR) repeat protein
MERIEIETHDIIKQQPNWVKDFLESIQISQNKENMALMNMTAIKIEEVQGNLFLEILLQQSENFEAEIMDFSQGKSKDYPYFETSVNLRLWLDKQHIKFSCEQNILSNTDYEDWRLKTIVKGYCFKDEVKIMESLAEQIKFGKEKGEKEEYDFYNYDQALQHFIKELLLYQDSWQQHFFKDKLKFSWKPYLTGLKDLVLRCSFEEYVVKLFGSSFLTEELKDLPKLIYGQLLEYSEKDLSKFQLLKKELLEYKRLEEKWPKDMLEVVLKYYDKNFASPLHEFDEQIIFIAMRYYKFPFLPELTSNLCFFDDIGEIRPDLTIGDFGGFFEEFFEWKEWVNT